MIISNFDKTALTCLLNLIESKFTLDNQPVNVSACQRENSEKAIRFVEFILTGIYFTFVKGDSTTSNQVGFTPYRFDIAIYVKKKRYYSYKLPFTVKVNKLEITRLSN